MNFLGTVSDDKAEVLLSYEDRMAAIGEICQLLKEAKLGEALEGASMLVEMFPDKPKLQADLGGILFRMGEYDSAELHASIAVDLDPANVIIRHFRAMCSEKRQDYLCAQADYQAVALMSKHEHQKVAALKQSERVKLQLTAMCEQSHDGAAVGKKGKQRTVASAMAKIAELEATANCGLEIRAEARYLSSVAKSDAHSNQTEVEENRLTIPSHAQAEHGTAQQTITVELEEEDRLTVTPLADHGNDVVPEEEGGDSKSPRCSCQSHPALDQSKPQFLSGLSSALAKQNSDTSYSMLTNNKLQHDGDVQWTDPAGAGATPESSPESVHEPLLITSKRQVLPLSWSKACRTPGSPSMAQMSTAYTLKKAGDAAYHTKLYPDALEMYNQCIEICPGNAILLNNRASVHLRLGHWDDAIADSDAALHVVPRPNGLSVTQALCRLAKAWLAKGKIAVSLAVGQNQLQKDPAHQALNTLQADLSTLLAAKTQESIDAPLDDLHQPADKSNGDPDPEPLIAARHKGATRDPAKVKTGSAGAQHNLASLAAEHTFAARQLRPNVISSSKPLEETASPEAPTSIKTQTYTKSDVTTAPFNSPAADGPACKHTETGSGATQPELPIVTSNQPGIGCQCSSADSSSACTTSVFKPTSTVRINPANSDPLAAKL
ncbi:TPA: hypothetical protein ACH3X2_012260 [Trebouxia sp. C0005]